MAHSGFVIAGIQIEGKKPDDEDTLVYNKKRNQWTFKEQRPPAPLQTGPPGPKGERGPKGAKSECMCNDHMYCVSTKQEVQNNQPISFGKITGSKIGNLTSNLPTITSQGLYDVSCCTGNKSVKILVGNEQVSTEGHYAVGLIFHDGKGQKTVKCILDESAHLEYGSCILKIVKIAENV